MSSKLKGHLLGQTSKDWVYIESYQQQTETSTSKMTATINKLSSLVNQMTPANWQLNRKPSPTN